MSSPKEQQSLTQQPLSLDDFLAGPFTDILNKFLGLGQKNPGAEKVLRDVFLNFFDNMVDVYLILEKRKITGSKILDLYIESGENTETFVKKVLRLG